MPDLRVPGRPTRPRRRFRSSFIGLGVVAVLAPACGDAGAGTVGTVRVSTDTVGSTVHVRNHGTPPVWAPELVLRLGSLEGGPQEFGRIRSLLADEAGNVYVADNLAQEIRVFSSDGRHLRTFGRRGGGPGEFGDLYSLAWLGENLAATDPANARIGVFSRTGEWIDGIQSFPITGPPSWIRLHPLGSEGFYAQVIDPKRESLAYVRHTAGGARDTIATPTLPNGVSRSMTMCRIPNGMRFFTVPQGPQLVLAFPSEGGAVAASWTESYRLSVLDAAGDTLQTITRERAPLPYPDELWEEAIEPYRELMREQPGTRCDPGAPERPRHRAVLRHVLYDHEGRLWVEAATEDGFEWEIFDREGRLLGAAQAPSRVDGIPPYARNGHLYQVETGDMEVQYVAVYRVIP